MSETEAWTAYLESIQPAEQPTCDVDPTSLFAHTDDTQESVTNDQVMLIGSLFETGSK